MAQKQQKTFHYGLRPLTGSVLAALAVFSSTVQATTFSTTPMVGVGHSYPPNVLLALSVEYPTAGAAYNPRSISSSDELNGTGIMPGTEGSFPFYMFKNFRHGTDPQRVNPQNIPTLSLADFEKGSFIGYFDQAKCYSYTGSYFTPVGKADAKGYCSVGQYSGKVMNWLTMTSIDIYRQVMTGGNRASGLDNEPVNYQQGDSNGFTSLRRAYVNMSDRQYYGRNGELGIGMRVLGAKLIESGRVFPKDQVATDGNGEARFHNSDFRIAFATQGGRYQWVRSGTTDQGSWKLQDGGKYKQLNVVVEVCKPGFEESNCRTYGSNNAKPEGLMQEKIQEMRFSVFGYLNNAKAYVVPNLVESNADIHGGVLRARMKSLNGETTSNGVVLGNEINSDGTFVTNPDKSDATASNVSNSGVINYLNKFGDSGVYRYFDPAGELFYAGLRYLRGKSSLAAYNTNAKNTRSKDNFPAITDWNDPLLKSGEDKSSMEAMCRPNYMMYIGDTTTHFDNYVPNFYTDEGNPTDDPEIKTADYVNELLFDEPHSFVNALANGKSIGANAGRSRGSITGLAYWSRVNDIRTDLGGKQYVHSIFIDVVEGNNYKSGSGEDENRNSFYWAAKYGGFDADEVERNGGQPAIRSRSQWTNDATGKSSIAAFGNLYGDGVPKNYTVANSPENMVTALRSAFNNIDAKSESPSQTALGVAQNAGQIVDLSKSNNSTLLQSSYKKNNYGWQGDVIARSITASGYADKWNFAQILESTSPSSRAIWTKAGNKVVRFDTAHAEDIKTSLALPAEAPFNGNAADAISYVQGSRTKEDGSAGTVFRSRPQGGLLGTVVNSTVDVLPKAADNLCNSPNFSSLSNRSTVYSFAANDGMLHVLDENGAEKFAYIPSTALPKLKNYIATSSAHTYINDGSPVSKEVCIGNQQTSVIVGTGGRGGESVYALDASEMGSSSYTPSDNNVMWEFSNSDDNDLGLTVHKAEIGTVLANNAATPVAVVSGGYNAAGGKGYLFVLKLGKNSGWNVNSNYWKIPLGNTGVGAPKTVDTDGDGNIDRIYVGDESGKMWRADYSNGTWTARMIFSGSQPITGAPDVAKTASGYTVIFATGEYFTTVSSSTNQQNYAYGLFDTDGSTIAESSLLEQTVNTIPATTANNRSFYAVSANKTTESNRGWRLTLPAGFISVDDASVSRKKIAQFFAFNTKGSEGAVNQCTTSGQAAVIAVDLNNGGLYNGKLFDTNNDSYFNSQDVAAGVMVSSEGLALKRTNLTLKDTEGKTLDRVVWVDDTGNIRQINMNPLIQGIIRRISWREIFM